MCFLDDSLWAASKALMKFLALGWGLAFVCIWQNKTRIHSVFLRGCLLSRMNICGPRFNVHAYDRPQLKFVFQSVKDQYFVPLFFSVSGVVESSPLLFKNILSPSAKGSPADSWHTARVDKHQHRLTCVCLWSPQVWMTVSSSTWRALNGSRWAASSCCTSPIRSWRSWVSPE